MQNLFNRILRLLFGIILYSFGIVLTIRGNIGLLTWDVLHQGLSIHTGITMGQGSISVGFVIVIIVFFMGEKIGFGTVLNMLLIGTFMDLFIKHAPLPMMNEPMLGFLMTMTGFIVLAFATYFYIGAGFGAGPRDSLMVLLVRKLNCKVGVARALVEGSAVAIGWFLGGYAGVGTIISVFAVSIAIQVVFRLMRFEVEKVKQESLADTFISVKGIIGANK
jgi:uncharacterized membrane protein YczE